MKKQLINEAFRLQQLAGIQPINSLNENTPGFDTFMDQVDSIFKPGTMQHSKLAKAVEDALDNSELEVNQYGVDDAHGQVLRIARKLDLVNEESYEQPKSKLDNIVQKAWEEDDINKAKNLVANYIKDSKINNNSKKTILNKMKAIVDKEILDYYLANSLLKFEKMGLSEGVEGYSYYYDFNGNESNAHKVMGNANQDEGIEIKSVTLADKKSYEIGDEEPEEWGKIISIVKWPNGYEIASLSGFDEEEYQVTYK
jgi:hypothetical protein